MVFSSTLPSSFAVGGVSVGYDLLASIAGLTRPLFFLAPFPSLGAAHLALLAVSREAFKRTVLHLLSRLRAVILI